MNRSVCRTCLLLSTLVAVATVSVLGTGLAQDDQPGATQPAAQSGSNIRFVTPADPQETVGAANRAVRESVRRYADLELKDVSLAQLGDQLESSFDIPVYIDELELRLDGFDFETTRFKGSLSGVQLNIALSHLLADHDVGFYVEGGLLVLTSKDLSETAIYPRVYDVDDLLQAESELNFLSLRSSAVEAASANADEDVEFISQDDGEASPPLRGFGFNVNDACPPRPRAKPGDDPETRLIDAILRTIENERHGWQEFGTGGGTLHFFAGKLIVMQTMETHDALEDLLAQLRTELPQTK